MERSERLTNEYLKGKTDKCNKKDPNKLDGNLFAEEVDPIHV